MRILRHLVLVLVLVLFVRAASALNVAAPAPLPGHMWWRSGGLSAVYRDDHRPRVVKIIGSRALPPSRWVNYPEWLVESGGRISAAQRRALTAQSLAAYAALKADPIFGPRYGTILPTTHSPSPYRIDQRFVRGLAWDELSRTSRQRAGAAVARILLAAGRALSGQQVDYNKYNFVFDQKGHVRAWVDWVISEPPPDPPPR